MGWSALSVCVLCQPMWIIVDNVPMWIIVDGMDNVDDVDNVDNGGWDGVFICVCVVGTTLQFCFHTGQV